VPWPWTSLCTKIGPVTDQRSTSHRRPIEDPLDTLVNGGAHRGTAGLVSVVTSSALANVALKSLHPRSWPDRIAAGVISTRHTRMPDSSSFPSGHSASGFAFATAVGYQIPALSLPLRILAAAVAYSRVHSGVHYAGGAIVGTLAGGAVGLCVAKQMDRRSAATS
jgi:undecaprenyl-diphosphatase